MTVDRVTVQTEWDVARVVASHDIFPNQRVDVRAAPPGWQEILSLLSEQRLCGLALSAAHARVLNVTAAQYDELLECHEMQLALDLRIERLVLTCFAALADAGIDALLLKGPATARRFYTDPSLRSFGDADVLVPRRAFRAALGLLADLGFSQKRALPRPWFDRYIKAACLVADDGLEVDVHQMLTPGPYGIIIDCDAIFRGTRDEVYIGQRPIPCLSPPIAFIHACVHAALGDPYPRFVSLRDVVEILRNSADESEVSSVAREWQLEPVIARALFLAEKELGGCVEHPIVERFGTYQPSRRDQWRLSAYESDGPRFARQSAATFWELKSLKDKTAYALALALPARHYLRSRETTYSTRLRQGITLARESRPT